MKKLSVLYLLTIIGFYAFAGGVEERGGQNYFASVVSTTAVHDFVEEGKYKAKDIEVGPGNSDDGTFKNGVWYWAGLACLKTSGVLRNGNTFQFKAGPQDQYKWLTAKYTGEQVTVSIEDTYALWGTIAFRNNNAVIEIRYIDPFDGW